MIEEKKAKIVEKYGVEPTISGFYYAMNTITMLGRDQVEKSLNSVKHMGDVVIGDYGSIDGTSELAEELGFRVLNVEKTLGEFFHESKILNKVISETKSNFLIYLNFKSVYNDDLEAFCKNWLENNNVIKKCLKMVGYATSYNNEIVPSPGVSHCSAFSIYRPYLVEARGCDERVSYHTGSRNYVVGLIEQVYNLKIDEHLLNFVHIPSYNPAWKKVPEKKRRDGLSLAARRLKLLSNNFDGEIRNVRNSYW